MYRFILFLKRISFVLLFIAIEAFALRYFSNSSSYNQAKVINASNFLTGDIRNGINGIRHFFSLAGENRRLTEEVAGLREQLLSYERRTDSLPEYTPENPEERAYLFSGARVVNNSITRSENFITLDKGARDGVAEGMAVISDGAVVGYILNSSDKFSVAISILNTKFRTSGRIKDQDYDGSILWDGLRTDEVMFSEIPKYAPIQVGDTIVTTEYSSYFPPNLKIGTVQSFELINGTYYDARLKLSADVARLRNVVLVDYKDREEKRQLEHETLSRQNY